MPRPPANLPADRPPPRRAARFARFTVQEARLLTLVLALLLLGLAVRAVRLHTDTPRDLPETSPFPARSRAP